MNNYIGEARKRSQNLLIVEGKHEKDELFKLLFQCFPEMKISRDDIWIYGTNIYMLYDDIVKEYGEQWEKDDIDLPFVISKKQGMVPLRYKEDFTNIMLVFDYERHDTNFSEDKIIRMQKSFMDSTDMGKLYINYPMVESLKYTKQMPDNEFYNYIATREDCASHKFKSKAETFAYSKAKAYRFIDLNKTNEAEVAANWVLLKGQNVKKANYIVNDIMDFPTSKDAISQRQIFNAQKTKFVRPSESVSILNSFPIFLYDYFK